MRRKPYNWTNDEDILLTELYNDHTAKEIAEIMGISTQQVRTRASTLFLSKYPIRYLVYNGDNLTLKGTKKEIVEKLNITDGTFRFYRSAEDRKSTRLNSSHVSISYAVFCLK